MNRPRGVSRGADLVAAGARSAVGIRSVGPISRNRGLLGLGIGLAAAGVGAAVGLAAERVAVGRPLLGAADDKPGRDAAGERYGSLRGERHRVPAADGTVLHVEVDEADLTLVDGDPVVTVVFSHGYALNLDAWHYQRKALRGHYRLVLWDQRGHGRSQRGPVGSATIDKVGADLEAVLVAVAPDGPLILVGHSMGGMTVMSLAAERRKLFDARVLGVALLATSAGGLGSVDFGVPRIGRYVQRLAPATVSLLARRADLVERGRRIGSDIEQLLVRRYSFDSDVPEALVRFAAAMIASTRIEVVSDFLPTFSGHDKLEALAAMDGVELLVLTGEGDLMIPHEHSEEIVKALPGAEHVVVRHAGHLVFLEHPEVVTGHLQDLIDRAVRGSTRGSGVASRPGPRRTVSTVGRRPRRRRGVA